MDRSENKLEFIKLKPKGFDKWIIIKIEGSSFSEHIFLTLYATVQITSLKMSCSPSLKSSISWIKESDSKTHSFNII